MDRVNMKLVAAAVAAFVCLIGAAVVILSQLMSGLTQPVISPLRGLGANQPGTPNATATIFFGDLAQGQSASALLLIDGIESPDITQSQKNDMLKNLDGYSELQVVSIGQATLDPQDPGGIRDVPYTVKLKDGTVKNGVLQERFDNMYHRWSVSGGY